MILNASVIVAADCAIVILIWLSDSQSSVELITTNCKIMYWPSMNELHPESRGRMYCQIGAAFYGSVVHNYENMIPRVNVIPTVCFWSK